MDGRIFAALMLVVIGAFGLWYGVANDTSASERNELVQQRGGFAAEGHSISIPIWGGIGLMLVGGYVWSRRRRAVIDKKRS
jgi:LPXTG-motif cell wall-anchored protein